MKIILMALLLLTSGFASASASDPIAASASTATFRDFKACTNFDCNHNVNTSLSDSEWRQVSNLFKGVKNSKDERAQIKQAIAKLEILVGAKTGTSVDLAGNKRNANYRGQLDCTAEATNTTTYLYMLENGSLLKWHKVHDRVVRDRFWMVPHWTGVIEDKTTGVKYSVDSWFKKNGVAPVVVTLERWYNKK
jgi:hypothetical protein